MWRTAYHALQPPLTTFGLGQTNNFVDGLGVGYPRALNQGHNSHTFESVIPNAIVYVVPPDLTIKGESKLKEEGEWTVQLLLNPADYVPWVALAVAGVMLVLSTLVIAFKYREWVILQKYTISKIVLSPFCIYLG